MRRANRIDDSDPVDVAGEVKGETQRAYRFYDGSETVWLPKSLCEWDGEVMTMPEWLALERGLT